ncbi:MAG: methylenetetrahydromethanopterin dehydrogenase [Synergistetes bacterium]|nr:methylenetetrahydromethanopterin dehydrogenase [Synergistota bacterium]MCX8128143.1 methylenetetrahydromethanopterin dehydrogenase [Synergistota bacterium]MDW8192519.1 methylene-tetrahydromethanopterin dehydrogenase N-terminal domain-containing protein [Synergistota bacterium]
MEGRKKIFLFITSEKHPSPFDIFVMYDAGADAVLSYGNVLPEEVSKLVIDTMFSRGPKGIKNTAILIGGNTINEGKRLLEEVKKTLFAPFEISFAFDPRGACTTGAAIVALVKKFFELKLGENLEGKTASILAGGGNIGSMTSYILASQKVKVNIVDIDLHRANETASNINFEYSEEIAHAFGVDKIEEACLDSDLIISTGPPGVEILKLEKLKKLKKCKLLLDTNPIPPYGIEGLTPDYMVNEVIPGIYGIGSKAIGALKLKTERAFLKKTLEAPKGFFGPFEAFEIAYSMTSFNVG